MIDRPTSNNHQDQTGNEPLDLTTLIFQDSGNFTYLRSNTPTDKENSIKPTEPILPILLLENRAAHTTAESSTDTAAARTQSAARIISRLNDDNFSTRQEASKDLQEFLAKDREKNIAMMSSLWKQAPENLEVSIRIKREVESLFATEFEQLAKLEAEAQEAAAPMPTLDCLTAIANFFDTCSAEQSDTALKQLRSLASIENFEYVKERLENFENDRKFLQSWTDSIDLKLPFADDQLIHEHADTLRKLNIKALDLGHSQISNEGLLHLSQLANLQKLALRKTNIGSGIKHLSALKSLTDLDLSGTVVGDSEVRELATMKSLKSLSLPYTKITDAAIALLPQLPSLECLNLARTRITDECSTAIAKMPGLIELDISGTSISDRSLANKANLKGLKRFRQEVCKSLRRLPHWGLSVS